MVCKTIKTFVQVLALGLLITVHATAQDGSSVNESGTEMTGTTSPSVNAPELPSFEGFVRFHNDHQMFLTVRRVGYRTIEVQSPGAESWMRIQFQQLAPEDRTRVLRKTLIDEELNPPEITGIRVTLESGEVVEGFTEGLNPARSSGTKPGSENGDTGEADPTEQEQSYKKFVVLTANQGRRELSSSLVKSMETISVNPIKMVGAQELYALQRKKRNLKNPNTHWKLGKLCMKTELYEKAARHFQQAGKMHTSFQKPAQLRLDILRNLASSQGESGANSSGGG